METSHLPALLGIAAILIVGFLLWTLWFRKGKPTTWKLGIRAAIANQLVKSWDVLHAFFKVGMPDLQANRTLHQRVYTRRKILGWSAALIAVTAILYHTHSAGTYHASRLRSAYHKPSCEWAKRIQKENLIFFHSKKEAELQGYHPCHYCNP